MREGRLEPTPSGGVQFHWEAGPRYSEVELVDPALAEYYFVERDAQVETEGELHVGDSLDVVIDFARRMTSPHDKPSAPKTNTDEEHEPIELLCMARPEKSCQGLRQQKRPSPRKGLGLKSIALEQP